MVVVFLEVPRGVLGLEGWDEEVSAEAAARSTGLVVVGVRVGGFGWKVEV